MGIELLDYQLHKCVKVRGNVMLYLEEGKGN